MNEVEFDVVGIGAELVGNANCEATFEDSPATWVDRDAGKAIESVEMASMSSTIRVLPAGSLRGINSLLHDDL